MKRGLYKISYMVVLMAMVLLMGTRFIPHHHCASSDNGTAHAVHFGYNECDSCDNCCHQHSHGCDHSHSEQQCCNDFQFYLRIYDDDNSFVNNIFNSQPSIALSDIYIHSATNQRTVVLWWYKSATNKNGFFSCASRTSCSLMLRDIRLLWIFKILLWKKYF